MNDDDNQSLPALPSATQTSTNYCMYYIRNGDAGKNESEALATCCSPNEVHDEFQNAHWCEIPDRFFRGLPAPGVNDGQASRWLEGNFTRCQEKENPQNLTESHYCNLPKYNPNIAGAPGSFHIQQQLIAVCLLIWFCFFFR